MMNTHKQNHPGDSAARARRRSVRRWLIGTALAVAAVAAGSSFANGMPDLPGHFGHHGHAAMDPAAMDVHIDKMIAQCAPDASPDQKARLAVIARAAVADLRPAHEQLRQGHARAHALLTAPVIDRAALEQLRAEQMGRMDAISRRILVAVEDAAEVLTPEQRLRFAELLHAHMR